MPRQYSSRGGRARGGTNSSNINESITSNGTGPLSGASKFSPNLLDGLKLWIDAADKTTINGGNPSSGDSVTRIMSKDLNRTQVDTTGPLVVYKTDQLNNNSILLCTGDYLRANIGTTVNNHSVFLVVLIDSATAIGYGAIYGGLNAGGDMTIALNDDGGGNINTAIFQDGTPILVSTQNLPRDSWTRLYTTVYKGAGETTLNIWNEGALRNTARSTPPVTLSTNPAMVLSSDAAYTITTGQVAEVIVYSKFLTPKEVELVDNYLKAKWKL
jgi:hypothetical protein